MFLLSECIDEAKRIVGSCSDEILFRWCADAASLIINKGDFEDQKAYIDICSAGGPCFTMPREVLTVLAVNTCGCPMLGVDALFTWHQNGPGDSTPCDWRWQDQNFIHSTQRDIVTPSRLVAYLSSAEDNGKRLLVFGYDVNGNRLRHQVGGQWKDGHPIPTLYGYAIPASTDPVVARIVGVEKDITAGPVRLSTMDDSGTTGVLLGVYEPSERLPRYRRIKISKCSPWIRVAYRKTNPVFTSREDHVPLQSRIAFLCALRACKFYHDALLGDGTAYEAHAARMEQEAQSKIEPNLYMPAQIVDLNGLNARDDIDIR